MPSAPLLLDSPAAGATGLEREFAERNATLNRTHDMAGMRARGGRLVRAIEERRRRLVAHRVVRLRPRVAVDVGGEDGWIAEAWASRVGETVIVDLDPAMAERARARRLPRTRVLVGDATDPGLLPRGGADVIVLSAVLEHLPRPADALRALAPALVAGGRFVVFVPADRPILAAKRVLAATGLHRLARGVSLEPAPGHLHAFDRASLSALLAPFGSIEELELDPAVLGYAATVRVDAGRGAAPPASPAAAHGRVA
jgi:SAM-dependent methyltransferase